MTFSPGWVPRPDAAEVLERDLGDVPRRGIGHPREDDVGPKIGVGEALAPLACVRRCGEYEFGR